MKCRICGSTKNIKDSPEKGYDCKSCYSKLKNPEYDSMYVRPDMHHRGIAYCMRCGRLLSHKAIMGITKNKSCIITHFEKVPTLPHNRFYRGIDEYVVCDSCMNDIVDNAIKGNEFIIRGFSELFKLYPYEEL